MKFIIGDEVKCGSMTGWVIHINRSIPEAIRVKFKGVEGVFIFTELGELVFTPFGRVHEDQRPELINLDS